MRALTLRLLSAVLLCFGTLSWVPARAVSFTVHAGTNFAAALSPDKSRIVIDLQGALWLLPARGGDARRIAGLPGEARYPSWSPDGRQLAFQAYAQGQWHIWTLRLGEPAPRQLTSGPCDDQEPVWTPDSKGILFSSDRAGNYDVWQINLVDDRLEQLTKDEADEYFPAVSPDGQSVAFVANRNGRDGLYVRSRDGEVRQLVSSTDTIALPAWSGDGSRLAFVSYLARGVHSTLKTVDVRSQKVRTLSDDNEDVFVGRSTWLSPEQIMYTADGQIKRRGFTAGSVATIPFNAMFSITPRATYPRRVQNFVSTEPRTVHGILHPVVSPDGTRVAFVALGDLWLLEIGDAKPRRLTNDAAMEIQPSWSPDGRRLVFASDRRGVGTMDLYMRDLATGKDQRLTTTDESLSMPAFSPDGRRLALLMTDSHDWQGTYLHVLDLTTGELRKIHGAEFNPGPPSWTADGKLVSMVVVQSSSKRDRKGLNTVLLEDPEGRGPARYVTPTPGKSLGIRQSNGVSWSPDGKQMAFVEDGVLWTVPVSRVGEPVGVPRRWTNEIADYPSWTADSNSIVYLSVDQLRRVFLDDGHVEKIPLELSWTPAIARGRKVIHAGRLFDGKLLTYRTNVDILIEDNRIKDVLPRRNDWRDAEVIDASGQVVIPGLFENHVHNLLVNGETTGRLALAFGLTSMRQPGSGDPSEGAEAQESWGSGRRVGPRLFTTGLLEGGRVYYAQSLPIASLAYLDLELDRAKRLGYDFIKTYERLDDAFLNRTVAFAHCIGAPTTSHDLYPATSYGTDAVEHLETRDRWDHSDRISAGGRMYDDVLQLYVKSGVWIVPTAVGANPMWGAFDLAKRGRGIADVRQLMRILPKRYLADPRLKASLERHFSALATDVANAHINVVRQLDRAGVSMPPGTDTSFPNLGFSLVTELQAYVDAGISPARALQLATVRSAELNGVGDLLGSIEPGKLADLVILDGDPLRDVFDLLNVVSVFKDGRKWDFAELLSVSRQAD